MTDNGWSVDFGPLDPDPLRAPGTDEPTLIVVPCPPPDGDWDGWRGRLAAFLLGTIVAFGLVIAFGARGA